MPSGFAHAGVCYSQKQAAVESFAASAFPRVRDAGSCVYVQSAAVSGADLWVTTHGESGGSCGAPSIQVYAVDLVACDPLTWTPAGPWLSVKDAGIVSAAIVGVWLLAFAWKAAYRALRGDETPSEG